MKKSLTAKLLLALAILLLVGCGDDDAFRKSEVEQDRAQAEQIRAREKAKLNTMNCYLRERVKNENGKTTCIYNCPGGLTESESVSPGESCPSQLNVMKR